MATESPIRMIESTDIWSVPKKSARYKSSSGRFLFEDLGFLLRSPEKDVMPGRSESAPPSMEGSMAAIRNMSSFQGSSLNHDEICESISSMNLDMGRHSHSDGSSRFPVNSLPVHTEEPEDDQSSVRSGSVAAEKATVSGGPSTPLNSKKDDSYCSSSPSHDRNNSHSCKSRHGTFVFDTDSRVHAMSSVGTNASCSDNTSQISSVDGTRDIAVWPYVSNFDSHNLHKKEQSSLQNNMIQPGVVPREYNPSEVRGTSPPCIVYPGITAAFGGFNQFHNASSGVPVANAQPILHASGYAPPLYANAAAFMASSSGFYPYLQPAEYVAPVYFGGYNLNPAVFPHQASVPFALGGTSFPNPGVPNGANVSAAYALHGLPKYYGQVGVHMYPRPSMHYFQPTLRDSHGYSSHLGHQTSRDGASVNQINSFSSRKSSDLSPQSDTSYSNVGHRRRITPGYYNSTSPKDVDARRQIPSAYSKNVSGNRSKTNEKSPVWDGSNSLSFLEELKSGKGPRFELPDIFGHIIEFSVDQHGSRFIQQKLETCSIEEKESLLKEVVPHASKLITDVFGNYVIQKLFEYGSTDQRKYLTDQLEGQILPLSLQMYGCRVIQKALEVIALEEKIKLIRELDGHIMKCVYDQNGNHVVQKCIESIPIENIHFVVSSFRGHVEALSMHPYGCRVVQRVLEHCSDNKHTQFIVDEILDSVSTLAQDQYGNYVTQQVLVKGKPHERRKIVEKLAGSVVQLSQHKFASNVIEKCIEFGDFETRELLIRNIVSQNDNFLIMMKDQFANYVVQKILDKCSSEQWGLLLGMIGNHLNSLKKYTYGKHIVARFERLCSDAVEDEAESLPYTTIL